MIVSLPKLFLLVGLVPMSNFLSACNGVGEFSHKALSDIPTSSSLLTII
jgi:hypothetical protein